MPGAALREEGDKLDDPGLRVRHLAVDLHVHVESGLVGDTQPVDPGGGALLLLLPWHPDGHADFSVLDLGGEKESEKVVGV